jgi:hypothetical protein
MITLGWSTVAEAEIRDVLRSLLLNWADGSLNEQQVHNAAEQLWEGGNWPEYDRTDDRSVAIEVLLHLDVLNHQLITSQDVPAMLEFLDSPSDQTREAWAGWEEYWKSIDWTARETELASNPYYSTGSTMRPQDARDSKE